MRKYQYYCIQATFKGFSRTSSLMSPVVHAKENHLLNF